MELTPGLITLIIYIVFLTPLMLLGFYFARRKMFDPHHKLTMTLVVILNWVLIVAVMLVSYRFVAQGLPDNLSENTNLIATIHGAVGLIAQLMATYLVLLMWTENTPFERIVLFRIKNIKTPMRVTLSLWLITVLLGFGVYATWYGGGTADASDSPDPALTEEANGNNPDTTEEPETDMTEEADGSDPETDTTEEPDADNPETDMTEEADSGDPETDTTEEPETDATEESE